MSDFSNQLKARADIGRLIGEFVALKPGGNGFIGLCPFHSEKSPSFSVHQASQFYYCFGCHAHGDVYQFLMEIKKLSFSEAVEAVAERLGVPMPASSDTDPRRSELLRIQASAAHHFSRVLRERDGAAGRAYLQGREVPQALWETFGLGFAPASGRSLSAYLEAQGFAPTQALAAGLCQLRRESRLRETEAEAAPPLPTEADWSDLYDRFRGRLMFPISDERGRPIAFGGRALELEVERKAPKYLNSAESPLYVKNRVLYNFDRAREGVRELGYAILVEGYFDCLRVYGAGFKNVVASCGTALSAQQMASIGRWSKRVLVNFDPDTAGAAAAERSIGMLLEEGYQVHVVELEAGMDPDAFIRTKGGASYAAQLRASRGWFDYMAARVRARYDVRRPEGKIAALNQLLPYLSRIHDPILRQQQAENLAAQLEIEQPMISRQLLRASRERRASLGTATAELPSVLPAERVVLRTWLEWEGWREELAAIWQREELFAGLGGAPLAERLVALSAEGCDLAAMAQRLDDSDRYLMAELVMGAESEEPLSEAVVESALEALRERRQAARRRDLMTQIEAASRQGDKSEIERLLRQKQAMDQRKMDQGKDEGGGRQTAVAGQ